LSRAGNDGDLDFTPQAFQPGTAMAAYGLYTHIASNKIRSMFLLAGLFVLIYVMVFAGALIAEVLFDTSRTAAFYLAQAWHDLIVAFPFATAGSALWIVIAYFFHQSMIDAITGGHDVSRKEQPRLYNLLETCASHEAFRCQG
jgi:heat shock protein HtpX